MLSQREMSKEKRFIKSSKKNIKKDLSHVEWLTNVELGILSQRKGGIK